MVVPLYVNSGATLRCFSNTTTLVLLTPALVRPMRGVLVPTSFIAGYLFRGNWGGTRNRRVMPTRRR